ncbi:hypothetical protein GCM10029964_111850 [Kibdelosporangium lantanae]
MTLLRLDYPEVPVSAIAAGSARRFGDRTAFVHHDDQLTYAQLWQRACQFANGLLDRGVRPGDRVALVMPNCLAYPVAYYGLLLAGATFVPVNPLMPAQAISAQVEDAGAVLTLRREDVAAVREGQPESPLTCESTFTPRSRTWRTRAARPGCPRAYGCRTATSWSTRSSSRVGRRARCRRSTPTAAWSSTR